MDIRLCYEAGAVLFWLLFAYLFMDKFLFRGQLGEICFGKARRRMAKALRGAAGWFDPVKEERKKGRGQAKGKTGRKEIPAVVKTQEKELPPVKAEMKPTEKTAERNSEKTVGKQPETDSLVVTKSYGTRQQPPMDATGSGAIAGKENASTFAGRNGETAPDAIDNTTEVATLENFENDYIRKVVDKCHGNISRAAEMLGITRQTLYAKLKR